MIDLAALVRKVMPRGPSDFHLRAWEHPIARIKGRLVPLEEWQPIQVEEIEDLARRLLSPALQAHLSKAGGVNVPFALPDLGRFRMTICHARGVPTVALRVLSRDVPVLDDLNLPPVVGRLAMERRGLILVAGPAGSGKSTTLAAMVNLMNTHRNEHIVTVEDPIEYVFDNRKCYITQREIGPDVPTYDAALRLVLRQDPNVIVIGEMRDPETFRAVLTLAQTGHLVLSTLHTGTAVDTVSRFVGAFPEHRETSVRAQLASVLKGLICQRLIERADGSGLIPATEILVSTSSIFRAIMEPDLTPRIPQILARGRDLFGMQTFDQCVLDYYLRGLITEETALRTASSPMDFEVQLRRVRQEQRIEEVGAYRQTGRTARMEAILVLEIVGMTDLLVSQGDATFRAFTDRIEKQLATIVKEYRSRAIERHLDGFLMTFPNVDWAVLAIRAIFARLSEFNQLSEMEVAFRGGLHYGSTWVDPQSSRVGAAVHKAFRVCGAIGSPDLWGAVRPKEKNVVVATEESRQMLIPYNVPSKPLGGVPLKGFEGVHNLFELLV